MYMDMLHFDGMARFRERSCSTRRPPVASAAVTLRHRAKAADFPARLRDARVARGLTQTQLGAAAGLSKQAVSNLEGGRQGCTTHLCERLAAALEAAPAALAYGAAEVGGSAEGYGERLKQARGDRAMDEVARRLGYRGRSSIANLEAERQQLDLALAEVIARELEVPPAWLAYGVGEGPGEE